MEELRDPASEEEADILYGAIKALGNVRGDYVNFITPPRFWATWKPGGPPSSAASTHYTVRRDPVGWWRKENGEGAPVLQVKKGATVVMNFCPKWRKIVFTPRSTPSDKSAPSPRPASPGASDQP